MGRNWRTVTETVMQKWGLTTNKQFKPTSNARNEAMFKEATKFAGHLRVVERDLLKMHKEIEANFRNLAGIMVSPLPRIHEENDGVAVPAESTTAAIGGDVQVDRLTAAANELRSRLDGEVLQPIKQWMLAYKTIEERMARLEALRLETDSRRRTVEALSEAYEKKKSQLGRAPTHKAETEAEMTLRRMHHKEDKLQRTGTAFSEMEQTVYNSLYTLIKDCAVLRDYCAAAVLIQQECYVQAYGAFDASLPQLQSGPSGSGGAAPVGYDQQKAIEYADPAAAAMQPAAQPVIYTAPKTAPVAPGAAPFKMTASSAPGGDYAQAGGHPADAHRCELDQSYEQSAAAPAAGMYGDQYTAAGSKYGGFHHPTAVPAGY